MQIQPSKHTIWSKCVRNSTHAMMLFYLLLHTVIVWQCTFTHIYYLVIHSNSIVICDTLEKQKYHYYRRSIKLQHQILQMHFREKAELWEEINRNQSCHKRKCLWSGSVKILIKSPNKFTLKTGIE